MTIEPNKIDVSLTDLTYERMQPLLNQTFQQTNESGLILEDEINLIEIKQLVEKKAPPHSWQEPETETPAKPSGKRVPFSLVFRFPVGHEATQGIYKFTHPSEGAFEGVFLTPIAADENGLYLEAIFN